MGGRRRRRAARRRKARTDHPRVAEADRCLPTDVPDRFRFLLILDRAAVPAAVTAVTAPIVEILRALARGGDPDTRAGATGSGASDGQVTVPDRISDELWPLWEALTGAAMATPPGRQGALVDLLLGIHALGPVPAPGGGGSAVVHVWGQPLWIGMPVLGAVLREAWNYGAVEGEPTTPAALRAWPAINAFLATLLTATTAATAADGVDREALQFDLLGLWTMREACEGGIRRGKPGTAASRVDLLAGSMWMANAAPAMYARCVAGTPMPDRCGWPGADFEGRPWTGFCVDRWGVWKGRLGEALAAASAGATHNGGGVAGEVRRALAAAVKGMEAAEQK